MKATRRIQRRTNMAAVLRRCLSGPQTLADIATGTGITRPAAESVASDLIELGWLTETTVNPQTPRPGRPATYVGLSPDAGHVLSLDIGAHHVTAMIADLAGTILAHDRRQLAKDLPADARLEASIALARKVLSRAGAAPLWTCTVASPGVVHDGRVAYFGGDGMPGWQGLELDEAVRTALGSRVRSAGDCALGARGESWKGAAAAVDDVVFILAGKRTGAASVINGRVHEGLHGAAGLIGELPQLRWRELEDETFADSLYDGASPRREELFAAARRREDQALAALNEYADVLATGTAAMVLAVAPQVVVVGGAFSAQADLFLPRFTRRLGELCPFPPQVAASRLGDDAVVMGGLRLALDDILDGIDSIVREADYFPSTSPTSLWQ